MTNKHEPLLALADGVWLATEPIQFLGLHLTTTMTVLRLGDGNLLLYSPTHLTPERQTEVEKLGTVAHLYSPNLFHHLFIGDWSKAFPAARVHAPEGLAKKRPDLRIDRFQGSSLEPAFAETVEEHSLAGTRLAETVIYYRPAKTLVVADLVHNIGQPKHGWTKFYTKMMGFYDRAALSRAIRWTAFPDKAAARRSLDQLLALPFDKLVVGHGTPITEGAKEALAAAHQWLPKAG